MLLGSVAIGVTFAGAFTKADKWLFKHRISNFGSRRGNLLTAMVMWDLLYYWEHRFMHEVRLLWAHHVSHHSSERYNLSTALRQPWSPFLVAWVFAPMPLLGYATATTRRAGQLNLLYQYWIHTEAIDRLPPARREGAQHAVAPPRAPRRQQAVPRQELRRHLDRLGQAVRDVRARGAAHQVRPHQEHQHVQPDQGRLPRVRRHRPRRAPLGVGSRGLARDLRSARVGAAPPPRRSWPRNSGDGRWQSSAIASCS